MGFILFFNSVLLAALMFKVFLGKEEKSENALELDEVFSRIENLDKQIGALSADQYRLEVNLSEFSQEAVNFADKNRKDILKRLENSRQAYAVLRQDFTDFVVDVKIKEKAEKVSRILDRASKKDRK